MPGRGRASRQVILRRALTGLVPVAGLADREGLRQLFAELVRPRMQVRLATEGMNPWLTRF